MPACLSGFLCRLPRHCAASKRGPPTNCRLLRPAPSLQPRQQGLLDPKSLEDLTGLTELHAASEAALEAWEASDDEEGEAGSGSGEGEWCEL